MELVKSPDSWLEKKVRLFNFKELNAKEISGRMASIMLSKNGIGLAANQVALDAQIFVMRPIEHEEVTKPFAVINPEILEVDENTVQGKEGCLSHIGLILTIT